MPLFIKLSIYDRRIFFAKLKEKINSSWEKFYPKYNISRASFFVYLLGKSNIPKRLFEKWKTIAQYTPKHISTINQEKYMQKKIPAITFDNNLAEIFGVLNGDGYISPLSYEIAIIGNRKEIQYSNYLKKLLEDKLKIKFNLKRAKSIFTLRGYSIELSKLLTEVYGLPKGNKTGKLHIPISVKKQKTFLINYLRGLFDTDGTFYLRRETDPVIEISSGDKSFLQEIEQTLLSLNFKAGRGEYRVFIYNKQDIARFFDEIKPANTKHLNKYRKYLKLSAGGPMAKTIAFH